MVPLIVVAIGLLAIGGFIYVVFRPDRMDKKYMFQYVLNIDSWFVGEDKDKETIRSANRLALTVCAGAAAFVLLNGLIVVCLGAADIKEIILVATVVLVLPVRYLYIMRVSGMRSE